MANIEIPPCVISGKLQKGKKLKKIIKPSALKPGSSL